MWAFLGKIFGITSNMSPVGMIGAGIEHVAMLGSLTYLLANANQQITFTTSLGFVALIGGFAYVLIEVVRRGPFGP